MDLSLRRTARRLHVRAAQELLRTRIIDEKRYHLSPEDVEMISIHQQRIANIDQELKLRAPSVLVSQRLRLEGEALKERKRFLDECGPQLKDIIRGQKDLKKSTNYKKLSRRTDQYLKSVEDADSVLLLADEIVTQPLTYNQEFSCDFDSSNTDILNEIVTSALGKSSSEFQDKLQKALTNKTGVDDVLSAENLSFPNVPKDKPHCAQ